MPTVLPQVIVTAGSAGQARIVVDGVDSAHGPVERGELGGVLARIAEQAGGPVRIEVREPDGSRYADILLPPPDPRQLPQPDIDTSTGDGALQDEGVLQGEGFLPGEPVLVALVVATVHADAGGTVRLPGTPRAPRRVDGVILFGAGSGTILRRSAPADPTRRWRR